MHQHWLVMPGKAFMSVRRFGPQNWRWAVRWFGPQNHRRKVCWFGPQNMAWTFHGLDLKTIGNRFD